MTDTHYYIITCTRDEGSDWERSSSVVAVGEADAGAEWERAVNALKPKPYEQCVTLVCDEKILREYTENAVDVLQLAIDRLRGERVKRASSRRRRQ